MKYYYIIQCTNRDDTNCNKYAATNESDDTYTTNYNHMLIFDSRKLAKQDIKEYGDETIERVSRISEAELMTYLL
jgi:hypothetical protein